MSFVLPEIITPQLVEHIRATYQLHWEGLHGYAHWVRVCENGLYLAQKNGANQAVVALFAFTHDMDRKSDRFDPFHGPRAAERIHSELQGMYFNLSPNELKELLQAVRQHTEGHTQASLTVQTCWDADRLDLGRAGIYPSPKRLCTLEAKDSSTIEWAYQRSIGKDQG
jgi:uncharacterized protein